MKHPPPLAGGARAAVLLLVATLAATGTTWAQGPVWTLSGTVVDRASGDPIPAARVRLQERHGEHPTHASGGFNVPGLAPGSYTIVVRAIGYAPLRRTIVIVDSQPEPIRLELVATPLELEPLVVTGTLGGKPGEDVLSPTSVVAGAALDRRLDQTVAATVGAEPGVAVTSLGPVTARPVIRGLSGDRIVMLEDGVRPGDLSATSADHAVAIEPLTTRRIEVVRGPMSLLYGSSALGGVVNVVRDEIPAERPEHLHGEAMVQGTSVNDGLVGGGWATWGIGPVGLRADASLRESQDVDTPDGPLVNTGANTATAALGAAYIGGTGHVGGSYRYYDNDYGIPGGFVGGHPTGVDIKMRRHMVRAEGELHPQSPTWTGFRANFLGTDYAHQELEQDGELGTSFDQSVYATELTASHAAIGPAALGALGLRGQYRDVVTGGSLDTPSTWDLSFAGFIVEEVGAGPVRVQAGLRYDHAHYEPRDTTAFIDVGGERVPVRARDFGSVSGSVGGLWTAAEGVRVGASLSRAYRTPDFNELYSNGPHLAANSFDVGDPSLDEETGLGLDLFARLERGRIQGEVAAFWNELSNYIFPSSRGRAELGTSGGRPRFQYTNEDARFSGLEGSMGVRLGERWVMEGTVSWVAAVFTSDRAPIPVISAGDTTFVPASKYPPLIPPLNGRLELRYDTPGVFAGVVTRMADRQDRTGDFETETAGYAVADLEAGVRRTWGGRFHTITLRVENAGDRSYRDHLSRLKDIMPMPGRNISLLYRLAF